MESDNVIKLKGYKALVKELGEVEAEKFVTLIQQQPFDYTEWQKTLWLDNSINEISAKAAEARRRSGSE
ncbi:MAG: hypothetical protein ACLP05_11155 [Candidatus Kryptoniota bacterium]